MHIFVHHLWEYVRDFDINLYNMQGNEKLKKLFTFKHEEPKQ